MLEITMRTSAKYFIRFYCRAIAGAATAFGIVHGVERVGAGFINIDGSHINPTALMTLVIMELLQSIIFVIIGFPIAYIPSRFLATLIENKRAGRIFVYISSGILVGLLFLPLCASIPFLLFYEQGDPSYFGRCIEFSLPLTIAGALGGYIFSRCAHVASGNLETVTDHFS